MALQLFDGKGTPLDRQRFTWRELVQKPISKLDDDAFTRVRVILMNGIESEAVRFQHLAARMNAPLRESLARIRRIEHHQETGELAPRRRSLAARDHRRLRAGRSRGHRLVTERLEQLGGDSTVETPSADLVGIESIGLIQTVSDRRTTLTQSLHAALAAELIDHAGWELLIKLTEGMGDPTMVSRFNDALLEEGEHLRRVRGWYERLTLMDGGVG